jgi:hypothetical protein
MIIFIPVLVICMNANCEFMQAKTYYYNETQCRATLDVQKQHMRDLVRDSGQGEAKVIEGTCIDADIKTKSKTELEV